MKHNRPNHPTRICRAFALAATLLAALPALAGEPYMRVRELDAGAVALDVAVRTFERPAGPIVRLVGAVHIGDRDYYHRIQALIEAHDLVLYESVGGGPQEPEARTDEDRAELMRRRLRDLATLAARYHDEHEAWPTLEQLRADGPPAQQALAQRASTDIFGANLLAEIEADTNGSWMTFTSLGADNAPGGEGPDADLSASTRDVPRAVIEAGPGLQKRMADALGLTFQLDEMVFDRPNFKNSDMSVQELRAALAERGPEAEAAGEALLGALGGQGASARIAGMMLRVVERNPAAAVVARAVLADILSQADDLLTTQPGGMGELMEVILHERNRVVVRDLAEALETEPQLREVAIIYGAGHLDGLEDALIEELGYTPVGDEWFPAITADPKAAGVDPAFVESLRGFMRSSIEAQVRAAEAREARQQREDQTPKP